MKHLPIILLFLPAFFFLKKRFFDNTDYKAMINSGGIIIDVRSKAEFYTGHIETSLNIPLGDLSSKLDYLKDKYQAIITCCASGIRSSGAQKLLSAKGYTNVVNGGGWSNLKSKLGN
jgi:phage shock protein E